MNNLDNNLYQQIRTVFIFFLGTSIVLVGIVMIVLPGPAIIIIPLGLSILATKFIWARKLLNILKEKTGDIKDSVKSKFKN